MGRGALRSTRHAQGHLHELGIGDRHAHFVEPGTSTGPGLFLWALSPFPIQKLFGGRSVATPVSTRSLRSQRCDFVVLAQKAFCTRLVAPLQGSFGRLFAASTTVSRLNINPPNSFSRCRLTRRKRLRGTGPFIYADDSDWNPYQRPRCIWKSEASGLAHVL